jgi:hypothetical protein
VSAGSPQGGPRGRTFLRYLTDSRLGVAPWGFGSGSSPLVRFGALGAGPAVYEGMGGALIRDALFGFRLASAGSFLGTPRGTAYRRYLSDSRSSCPVGFRQWRERSVRSGARGWAPCLRGEGRGSSKDCPAAARYAFMTPMVFGERRSEKRDPGTAW